MLHLSIQVDLKLKLSSQLNKKVLNWRKSSLQGEADSQFRELECSFSEI